jgi:mRNA interferase RelE/StbE
MRSIPRRDLRSIVSRIATLASNPRPTGCEKLSGQERYRVRQGTYRIVYAIDDTAKAVDVVAVAHRREVYR